MTKNSGFIAIGFVIGFSINHLLSLLFLSKLQVQTRQFKNNTSGSVLLSNDKRELCQRKYILLTTQKSGSTWFCDVLDQQSEISCGGRPSSLGTPQSELVIFYSKLTNSGKIGDVTWQQYQNDLDKAFAEVCEYNPAMSIGFKVMYDQIPPQFIEDKRLQTYFKDNGVNLIHLVREAKILKIASGYGVMERGGVHHTTNSSAIQETSSLQWNEQIITNMLKLEKKSIEWQNTIHMMTPFVPNYYVSYENILGEQKRKQLVAQIVSFVSGNFHPNVQAVEGNLLKQSNSSCSARIANYSEFRAHKKVIDSRSAAACDLIDMII